MLPKALIYDSIFTCFITHSSPQYHLCYTHFVHVLFSNSKIEKLVTYT